MSASVHKERVQPTCSHCLEIGHTKASPKCPLKGKEPVTRIEKEPPSNRWTSEKEDMLISLVQQTICEPDWEQIAETVGLSISGCKAKYNERISPEEHIQYIVSRLKSEDIERFIVNKRTSCTDCKDVFYIPLYEWKGTTLCFKCHKAHEADIEATWKAIDDYLNCIGSSCCLFCNRSRHDGMSMNFDHHNMFEKEDSICTMVRRGDTLEQILPELVKCQVLCKSCHNVVTMVETMVGFRRAKQQLTRNQNGTGKEHVTPMTPAEIVEKQTHYKELYAKSIEPLYPLIKQLLQRT